MCETLSVVAGGLLYTGQHQLGAEIGACVLPTFPAIGETLKEASMPVGRHMSRVVDRLMQFEIDTDFRRTDE